MVRVASVLVCVLLSTLVPTEAIGQESQTRALREENAALSLEVAGLKNRVKRLEERLAALADVEALKKRAADSETLQHELQQRVRELEQEESRLALERDAERERAQKAEDELKTCREVAIQLLETLTAKPKRKAPPSTGAAEDSAWKPTEKTSVVGFHDPLGSGSFIEAASGNVYRVASSERTLSTTMFRALTVVSDGHSHRLSIEGVTSVDGTRRLVDAEHIGNVNQPLPAGSGVKSRIMGSFQGFLHGRLFPLANGEVWRQTDMSLSSDLQPMPNVTIFREGAEYRMRVEGGSASARVERIR